MHRTVALFVSLLCLLAALLLMPRPASTKREQPESATKQQLPFTQPAPEAKPALAFSSSQGEAAAAVLSAPMLPAQEGPVSATASPERARRSLSLNGTNAYVRVPNNLSLNITETITVDAWIKTNATSLQGIVERYKWLGEDNGGFALRLNAEGKLQFYTIRNSTANDSVTGSTTISAGVWHHVAGVFDGNELRVYLDGALDGAKPSSVTPAPGNADLRIGVVGDPDAYFFNGLIDEARVTSGVRYAANFTPEQHLVTCKYTVEADGVGCRGVWTFDNQTAHDSTSYQNHGTLMGGAAFSTETNNYQPETISALDADSAALAPDGELKRINFDELGAGVTVNTRYPDIIFSAQGNLAMTTESRANFGSSLPNWIGPSGFYNTTIGLNFPKPVDNLKFNILACDDFGVVAQVDIWQDNVFKGTRPVNGIGQQGHITPITFNVGAEFNHVTQVVVHHIVDGGGFAYDDFVFNLPFVPPPVPATPTNLRVTGVFAQKLDLAWNDVATNETGYKVERCTGAGCNNFGQIATLNPNSNSFRDQSVVVNTPYTYRVRAFNDGGHSGYSNPISGTPELVTPRDLTATVNSATQITLKWSNGGGFEQSGFSLERSTDGVNFRHVLNLFANTREVTDIHLEGGTTYHYRIRSYLNGQYSAYSNTATATTPACDYPTIQHPMITQGQGQGFMHWYGWDSFVHFSDDDGFVASLINLTDSPVLTLAVRPVIKNISIPYYTIETTRFGKTRGELKRNSNDQVLRSRVVDYSELKRDAYKVYYEARYSIDRLPNNSTSCLLITQRYEYYKYVPGERCEPSGTLPCARFRASVKYEFRGKDGEQLKALNIVQRTQYHIDGIEKNSVGLFLDCDIPIACKGIVRGSVAFERRENPLKTEIEARAIVNGNKGDFDNHHQTWAEERIGEPGEFPFFVASRSPIRPGCPECWHSHWRWGWAIPQAEGGGSIIRIPHGSNQDMNLAITKYRDGEEDPLDYKHLLDPIEPIRSVNTVRRFVSSRGGGGYITEEVSVPEQVVYWLSATGKLPEDTFFEFGGFFNPSFKDERVDVLKKAQGNGPVQLAVGDSQDKPTSVVFANLYQAGQTEYTDVINPASIAPLPSGYTVHNNAAFNIETTAITSGDNTVTFSVPSVTDQTGFNKLRILHAELDALDKARVIWVDRTILAPDMPAPNFPNKTISAKAGFLGGFIIAQRDDEPPVPVSNADLVITGSRAPDQLISGNDITYTFNVTNNGPEVAPDVNLIDDFSTNELFVSATPSQGSCSSKDARVTCKFGDLNPGARASVTIVLKVYEGEISLPAAGRMIANSAFVVARANDPNFNNNQITFSTKALPDPNPAPTVRILSPAFGSLIVGPANVTITAEASDSNGSVSKVDIYDGNQLVGTSSPTGSNRFSFNWQNVPFGRHTIVAVATDNQERSTVSGQINITINGSATVAITSPAAGAGFRNPATVQINAQASAGSGSIAKVEFFANFSLIGAASTPNGNQYSATWADATPGIYYLTAVVTDNAGITTTSGPVTVRITDPATVNILDPIDGATFSSSPSIVVRAGASNNTGTITKVEFFANGAHIGTDASAGAGQFFTDWNNIPDGIYQVTAVATDNFGERTTSGPVQIAVNVASPEPGELIWFDDALPAGAQQIFTLNDGWYWVDANPAALLNRKAHQSRLANDFHQHAFQNAAFKLPVNAGDTIFTYVFLDPTALPSEIMLEWKAEDGWEHRAYWGLNRIEHLGANGTSSRRFMGALPTPGRWVRLEIPVESVGLEGRTLDGMSFILFGGKATFDRTGKTSQPPAPSPAPGDVVWFDDAMPAGATLPSDDRVMKDDSWTWINSNPAPKSGSLSHRTFQGSDNETPVYRSHAFIGASTPLVIRPGDVLFTHVYLDPDPKYRPDQIILQWYDGNNWEHRAYWGGSYKTFGRLGTESQRYMGGIPDSGRWVRLEIPASYVGLEGKSISGMAFGVNRERRLARAAWDLTGKSTQLTVSVIPLQSVVPIYRFFNSGEGYSYWLNDIGPGHRIPQGAQWYVHPNQAAGTVPFYRFHHVSSGQFLYTQFRDGPNKPDANWREDVDAFGSSVSFYIYPNNTTPGVASLLLYRDPNNQNYFYTVNPNDPARSGMNGACNGVPCSTGFVNATSPLQSPLPNPIDDTQFFVRQHYLDFFNREPDAGGLAFWSNEINKCRNPAERSGDETESACFQRKRDDASGAFFLSIEFQETGYVLHRMHKASFGTMPVYQTFMPDLRTIGQGVVVLQPGWQQVLEANKRAFFDQWVTRPAFRAIFDSRNNAEYVDLLFANAGVPPQPERDLLVNGLDSSTETRATVLRKVADGNTAFHQSEFNRAFVLMQYFGYLRRHPSDPPDTDLRGYNFWLTKLNEHNGDWRAAEMVKSFIVSGEYRGRFGQPVPPVTVNSLVAGQNVSVKSGAVTSKFSMVANSGVVTVMPTSPWALGPPPEGYTFYHNVGYMVGTTSNVSAPITLNVNLAWQVDDPAAFTNLRILYREGEAWVDRTILSPNAPGPDFATRTLSAGVNSLSTFAIARVLNSNLAPSVTITSPTMGQDFHQPASVVINASASDAGGSISKMEFYQGDTLLGEDNAAPYSLTWNNVAAGSYTLTVRATDNGGLTTTAAGVGITVHGPPSVSIASPSNNTSFDAPANFTVSASADDPDGIKHVEFFQGGVSLGVDTAAPFEVNWTGAGVGTHSLTARATDNLNITTTSTPVSITVSNTAPNVAITSPASGTMAGNAPASITIAASANDGNGIRQVEFFQGATSLGVDLTAPYSVVWNNVSVGTYNLTAKATDNLSALTTSSPVSVTIGNTSPMVVITAPANGAVAGNAPASITIAANATDNEGIRKVEFFHGATKVGEDATAPYSVVWSNVAIGAYSLTAKATDNMDAVTTSAAISVTVANAPPSVSITSPSTGTNYASPASIAINANATDNEGIRKVEFFQGTTKLGEDATAPFSFNWPGVSPGAYSLTAKATDNLDAVTTSSAVSVTVSGALYTLFSDDFNDNAIDPAKWYVATPASASTVIERNQRLELTPATAYDVTAYNSYTSVPFIDVTNAQATIEVPQHTAAYGHETYFLLSDSSTGSYLAFVAGGGGLVLQDGVSGVGGRTVLASYNPTQHRYWRFRHELSANTLNWETSGDGAAWVLQRTIARTFAINAMRIHLGAGKYAGVASPLSTAIMDNLKVESPIANSLPTISITNPLNGEVFTSPASITINAVATDNDGAIQRVEFFSGATSLGVDTTAPFSLVWNNVATGNYSLTAKTTDSRGGMTTSAPVSLTVNAAPVVSLTMPVNGATYTAPAVVNVAASASDTNGTISRVEFFRNGVSIGVDTTSPYSVTWSSVAAGTYSLTATATDNLGTTTTSVPVSITVNAPANAAPIVSLTAPAHGAIFNEQASISLAANASDSDGTIAGVEFFRNGASLGTDTTAPYSFNWAGVPPGSYSLTAKATDNLGATTTSASVAITVNSAPAGARADTIGVYTGYTFHLRNSNTPGAADISMPYGTPMWTPVVGDWDGNGTTTLGVYVPDAENYGASGQSLFFLSDRLDTGYSDTSVFFGVPGDQPVVGDWDGNGTVTVGVYRPSEHTFYLRNSNTSGPADLLIPFLTSGDTALSGDWDGDGVDTIGIHNSGTGSFYLRNSNTSGPPSIVVTFGSAGDKPIVGDWNGDGITTVGTYRPANSTFNLRNSNTAGAADTVVQFGSPNSRPVVGNWDGTRAACCGDAVWFDDNLPTGAVSALSEESWAWAHSDPVPFSGTAALKSVIGTGEHSYSFAGATGTLAVVAGDKLFAYVYLDPANLPAELMIQWNDGNWEHRAYWGANNIVLGADGTNSRRYMGPLPPAGQWVRLVVPASQVGLEGSTLSGMSFNLYGGRATWDRAGKTTAMSANVNISEFRFRGSAGDGDEFVELYNNSDAPVTVCATDGSGGWTLAAADAVARFNIPNGTLIPARGHYLASGGSYSLGAHAAGDRTYAAGIEDNTGIALFNTRNAAGFIASNRFDAVGFSSLANPLYLEGTGLSPLGPVNGEYSFARRFAGDFPQDTNNNAADFVFISATGDSYGGNVASILGGPGPENLFSNLLRFGTVAVVPIDPAVTTSVSPNRTRLLCENTPDCNPTTAPLGTLVVRRKVTNNTGVTLTRLRFRVIDFTTLNSPGYSNPAQCDLRVITSGDSNITLTDGSTVAVKGTTLEQPPNQPNGGGYNSALQVALPPGGLPPGGSVNVQFVLGVKRSGSFRFYINVETLP